MPLGELAAIGSALLWALNSVLVRPLAQRLPALRITALQYVASALCMLTTAVLLDKLGVALQIPLPQVLGLVFAAFCGMGVGDTMYVRALSTAGVSLSYPVSQASYVLFTFGLSLLLLAEPITMSILAGATLLLAGVWALSRAASGTPARSDHAVLTAVRVRNGLLAAGFAGVCWALTTTVLKLAITDLDLVAANAVRIPMVALALNAAALGRYGPPRGLARRDLALIVLAGVVGMWCSSMLFVYAIAEAGAAKTAVLSSTSPLFASALAMVFLRERLTGWVGVGTVLAVTGMVVVVT